MTTSLAKRLLTLFSLLRHRSDLKFVDYSTGTGELPTVVDQIHWDGRIPEDFRSFAREVSSLVCTYTGPARPDGEPISGGINLDMKAGPGQLDKPEWVPEVDGVAPPVDLWLFCDVPDDWNGESTNLALTPGGAVMLYVYDNPRFMGSFTEYLTLGARRGFVSYWPNLNPYLRNTPADSLATLRAHSLDEKTPKEDILSRLRKFGIDEARAQDLWDFIGSDLTLYFQRT